MKKDSNKKVKEEIEFLTLEDDESGKNDKNIRDTLKQNKVSKDSEKKKIEKRLRSLLIQSKKKKVKRI